MNPLALLLGCSALALAGTAQASTPVQISLPGINLPSSHQVEGARASFLYGRTGQVKGIDLPVFALSDVDQFTGLQLGIFFGAGRVRHQFGGVAINAVNWHEGQDTGVNLGFVNQYDQGWEESRQIAIAFLKKEGAPEKIIQRVYNALSGLLNQETPVTQEARILVDAVHAQQSRRAGDRVSRRAAFTPGPLRPEPRRSGPRRFRPGSSRRRRLRRARARSAPAPAR